MHLDNEGMKSTSATELLRRLSPDEIRARLGALAAEEKALRTLLRAAVRMERGECQPKGAVR
jgi:hypothetical protein